MALQTTSNAALDLCVRRRPLSPIYYTKISSPVYVDSSTLQYSPVSNHSDSETSSTTISDRIASAASVKMGRAARPFKAYPKDPLHLTVGVGLALPSIESACATASSTSSTFGGNRSSVDAFADFRQRVLSQVQAISGTNKNMRRIPPGHGQRNDDPGYWEKRRKNNEAAKRSRDARRAKEDEIAIRCAFLEQENLQLKFRIANLESERQRLQDIVYHHS